MILVDRPRDWGWKLGLSAHLISTLPGKAGTRELVRFARDLGMNPRWIQRAGTEYEHFDLTVARCARAIERGARTATNREVVKAIRAKRGGQP